MNDIFYREFYGPVIVRGFTSEDANGDYNVYINGNLSEEAKRRTTAHELEHIKRGHFHDGLTGSENELSLQKEEPESAATDPGHEKNKQLSAAATAVEGTAIPR